MLFEVLRTELGLSTDHAEYAALVLPVYVVLTIANVAVISALHPLLEPGERGRVFRESGLPTLPLELLSGMFAATASPALGATAGLRSRSRPARRARHLDPADTKRHGRAHAQRRPRHAARRSRMRARRRSHGLASDRERLSVRGAGCRGARARASGRVAARRSDAAAHGASAGCCPRRTPSRSQRSTASATRSAETRAIISSLHPATVARAWVRGRRSSPPSRRCRRPARCSLRCAERGR